MAVSLRRLFPDDVENFSPLFRDMFRILQDWYPSIQKLELEMLRSMRSKDEVERDWLLCFDRYALRGVQQFVDILIRHRDSLQSSPFQF